MLHFISDLNAGEKEIKKACYERLDRRAKRHIGEDTFILGNLKVKHVQNEAKVYARTAEVIEAEEALEAAKEALQAAKDRAGFELKVGAEYWKPIR